MAANSALGVTDIGYTFKDKLGVALLRRHGGKIDWGQGLWQRVAEMHRMRKGFVHMNAAGTDLFPAADVADAALTTVREAIRDLHRRVGSEPPAWLNDNDDKGWDAGLGTHAFSRVTHVGGAERNAIHIGFVYEGREHIVEDHPEGTDPAPHIESLLSRLNELPITAIRVYRGIELVIEERLPIRGS
jgi:hypothetical protein